MASSTSSASSASSVAPEAHLIDAGGRIARADDGAERTYAPVQRSQSRNSRGRPMSAGAAKITRQDSWGSDVHASGRAGGKGGVVPGAAAARYVGKRSFLFMFSFVYLFVCLFFGFAGGRFRLGVCCVLRQFF
jgi:hypothetical protein